MFRWQLIFMAALVVSGTLGAAHPMLGAGPGGTAIPSVSTQQPQGKSPKDEAPKAPNTVLTKNSRWHGTAKDNVRTKAIEVTLTVKESNADLVRMTGHFDNRATAWAFRVDGSQLKLDRVEKIGGDGGPSRKDFSGTATLKGNTLTIKYSWWEETGKTKIQVKGTMVLERDPDGKN